MYPDLINFFAIYATLAHAAPQAVPKASESAVAADPPTPPSTSSSISPSGVSGGGEPPTESQAPSDAWMTAQCTTPDVTDASIDQDIRWNSVDTEDAWTAAEASWALDDTLSFPQQISNFFNGPEQMLCGQTSARDGCSSDVTCNNVNHPAGMFILNSFVAISDLNYNIFDSIGNTETAVTTTSGTFSTTFAPISDPDTELKLLVEILGLGFALFASPVWNSLLKAVPFFKANGNTLGTLKDWVNPVVSNGVTIAKDTGLSGAVIQATNTLNENLATIIQAWQRTVDLYNQQIFNGSAVSNNILHTQITQGAVLEAGFEVDDLALQDAMEKAVYGYLIPQAWALSNENIGPVVINSNAACGTTDPLIEYISTAIGDATWVCVNNIIYYLVGASGFVDDCYSSSGYDETDCPHNIAPSFLELPGEKELDGTQWGGVLKDDFIIGAINSYTANGNNNGGAAIDPTSNEAVSDIFDNGIRAAGVVQIPVCSAQEARQNWEGVMREGNNVRTKNFPCT